MAASDGVRARRRAPQETDAVVNDVALSLRARRHVILAGDLLLDRRGIVTEIAAALSANDVTVLTAPASTQTLTPIPTPPDGSVLIVDGTALSPGDEQWCLALAQRGVTMLLAVPSAISMAAAPTLMAHAQAAGAEEVVLAPLSAAGAHAVIAAASRSHRLLLAPVEVTWMTAVCGGSAPLLRALVQDYADDDPSAMSLFGRRTRVVATEALAEVPPALLSMAQLVAALPGVSRKRLRPFVHAQTLDLLSETAIAARVNDTIVINGAIAAALRLTASGALDEVAGLVARDIMTSLALGTRCDEAEVMLVADLLREHPRSFADVPWQDRSRLLFVAMWLWHRAGATERAAFVARQLMTAPGWENVSVLRSIARSNIEDLHALSADIRTQAFPPEAYDIAIPWVQCLSLPLTRDTEATRWAVDLTDAYDAGGADPAAVTALLTSLRAAGALQSHDLERARSLATSVLLTPGAIDATRLRALVILGAAASMASDGGRVERFVRRILRLTMLEPVPGLSGGLARRSLDDALVLCTLTLASLGAATPPELLAVIDQRASDAALNADNTALTRMVIARITAKRDDVNTDGSLRLLERLPTSELTTWLRGFLGGTPAPEPSHLVSGTFMDHARNAALLLTVLTNGGPGALAERWSIYPVTGTPFRAVCEAFLDLTVHQKTPTVDVTAIAALDLPENSLLGGVRDFVVGTMRADPELLTRALHAFIARKAWECARVANRDLSAVAGDKPEWSKQVKASQRLLQAEISVVATAQSALTPREREVMQLATQGLRNKQIAEQLFVSVRTVESHLYRALHKLSALE